MEIPTWGDLKGGLVAEDADVRSRRHISQERHLAGLASGHVRRLFPCLTPPALPASANPKAQTVIAALPSFCSFREVLEDD